MRIRKYHHNGIDFTMYQAEAPTNGEAALRGKRHILRGTPSITKAIGQYKYGDEVIVQVFNEPGSVITKKRVAENYDRIQIFFKKDLFVEICRKFLEDLEND